MQFKIIGDTAAPARCIALFPNRNSRDLSRVANLVLQGGPDSAEAAQLVAEWAAADSTWAELARQGGLLGALAAAATEAASSPSTPTTPRPSALHSTAGLHHGPPPASDPLASYLSALQLCMRHDVPGASLAAADATAAAGAVAEALQAASTLPSADVALALHCAAALAALTAAAVATAAAGPPRSASRPGPAAPPSPPPPPPAVLPLVPLLGAAAAGDVAAAEAALRRLNRGLARPMTAGPATTPASASASGSARASTSGSIRAGAASGGGRSAGLSELGTAGAPPPYPASLRAAEEAASRVVEEAARCRAAAVRLCTGRGAGAPGGPPTPPEAAEAAALRSACVAALAAAAADVRCHQAVLQCGVLEALPRLLRPAAAPHLPSHAASPRLAPFIRLSASASSATAAATSAATSAAACWAAVLLHNLAAPPSSAFRGKLRRQGVLAPLLDFLGSPAAAAGAGAGGSAPRNSSSGSALGPALTALACLAQGREGAEALRRPELRAGARLAALRARLRAELGAGRDRRRDDAGRDAGGARMGAGAGVGAAQALLASVEGLLAGLGLGPQEEAGAGRGGAARSSCAGPGGDWQQRGAQPGPQHATWPAHAQHGSAQHGSAQHGATLRGATWEAAGAEAQAGADAGAWRGGRGLEAEGGAAEDAATGPSSVAFTSEVVVGGRPLQLLSLITRTAQRRPDGSLDVRYAFQDQVAPRAFSEPS
ncbi:hypothetical protein HYH03_011265 [Edaphochlamys debaryana]|uniref:Uncharacterized protein n=1 Tax=Edaphochlamys debaryana TaxID=47281 RepID=A0A836BWN9_9CHLO|nr:hypothetical protein HYH03_011265 [Edaphochlamys debaryana]|eukprot:KAG2490314.1 hypothetical protein HYH03_011265 [Edaphochlamys debaryana]